MTLNTPPPTEPAPVAEQDDPTTLAAELLACTGTPDAAATLISEHIPDRSGRCRGCPHASTPAPLHPCRLRSIGEKLARIQAVTPDTESRRNPESN